MKGFNANQNLEFDFFRYIGNLLKRDKYKNNN